MKIIKTKDLEEGMVTASPVTTKHGQIIVDKGTSLTNQLIARISFYGIDCIRVETDSDQEPSTPVPKGNVQEPTYSQRIKNSSEFKEFQIHYTQSADRLKNSLSPILFNDITLDTGTLFQTAMPLLENSQTSIALFDMLHNMRAVNDSIYAHSLNVALITGVFGKWLNMTQEDLNTLVLAALLHDIGKIQIPTEILDKPGKYTEEEFALVQKHPLLGYQLLQNHPQLDPRIKNAALMHHERCDGSGYPQALSADAIDDFAQIIAIADVYDAMTAARSYRAPLCPFQVIEAFEKEGLQKYKPQFILTFLERIASTYQSNRVMLSDGRGANIVMLNKQSLSKPIVQVDDGSCIDLSRTPDLCIKALL